MNVLILGFLFATVLGEIAGKAFVPAGMRAERNAGNSWQPRDQSINATMHLGLDCPALKDIPIVNKATNTFYGIRWYNGVGHEVPALACNGNKWDEEDGTKRTASPGYGFPLGTLYVHEGCSFYSFEFSDYGGSHWEERGPSVIYKVPRHYHWNSDYTMDNVPSYIVDCSMKMPDCHATDAWKAVGYFDNSGSQLTVTYEYKHTVGSTWTNEMSEGFSVSTTVEETLKAGFFDIFEAELGISVTTGYDWQHTSSYAQSDVTERTVTVEIPPGVIIQIDQAYGTCGGNTVETELLRITDFSTGEVIKYI